MVKNLTNGRPLKLLGTDRDITAATKIDTLAMMPNMNFPMQCPATRHRILVQVKKKES